MSEPTMVDGFETTLPPEKVADLQLQEPTVEPEQPQEPKEPVKAPEPTAEPEKVQEPATPEAVVEPVKERSKKASPIADLLEKKHQAEEKAAQAEAENAELKAKLQTLSQQPANTATDDEIKALAEETGVDETVLAKIVAVARKGVNPELPKEVQELLAERQAEKLQQAELTAFNKRVDSLAETLKDDLLKDLNVREKLQKLAYSTDKAPDGEPYFQKEIAELYFGFVKPEVEPGKSSAEPSRGGTQGTQVLDFAEILSDDAKMEEFAKTASSKEWQSFAKWRDEKQGDTPIKRRSV